MAKVKSVSRGIRTKGDAISTHYDRKEIMRTGNYTRPKGSKAPKKGYGK